MSLRRFLSLGVQAAVAVVVVSLLVGSLLGQPVLLSYVETGSMEPTMEPGDGFVAVPAAVAGDVEPGDVVVFEAEEIQGGGLTTHRVVEETDRGFITRGDANPFTDQDSDEPPVKREQVVAVAWQPGGDVFVIPALGTAVTGVQGVLETLQFRLAALFGTRAFLGIQGLGYLVAAIMFLLYGLSAWLDDDGPDRTRNRDRSQGTSVRLVVAVMALFLVAGATVAMVAPSGTENFGIVSSESPGEGVRVIEQGTNESVAYPVGNSGAVPVTVFFEPGGDAVEVEPDRLSLARGSSANVTVTLSAPPETGYYRRFVTHHRYLAVLPRPVLVSLYEVHPWLPVVVIDALVGVPFYLLGVRLVGTGRIRRRSRDAPSRFARLWNRYL